MAVKVTCLAIHIALFAVFSLVMAVEKRQSLQKPCTYFGEARVSAPQGNLVNCSWYASNSCCKRTEVTSVFGSMYPLAGASKECTNKLNYLMCYFCSPDQYRWYDKKVHVCAEYCKMLYEDCKSAKFEGIAIGDVYVTGEDFCRGQKFEVVESNAQCFDFNPLVFDGATSTLPYFPVTMATLILSCFLQTR